MKSTIINFLSLLAPFGIAFWAIEAPVNTPKPYYFSIDTSYKITQGNINSINQEMLKLDEETNQKLKDNNEVLQDAKKELMEMDICLDSLCNVDSMEINSDSFLSIIE